MSLARLNETIKGADPNGEISGAVRLRKYGMFDGVAELDPNYENGSQYLIC